MLSKGAGSYIAILGSFSPLDLGSTLAAWWDFSDAETLFTDAGTTPVDSDGDAIYQANDKSGNDRHLIQSTEANRPLYKTAIQNELSVARFDGTNDSLATAAFSFALGDRTLFIVAKEAVSVVNAGLLVFKPATGNDYNQTTAVGYATGESPNCLDIAGSTNTTYRLQVAGDKPLTWGILAERKSTGGTGSAYVGGGAAGATDASYTEFGTAVSGVILGARWLASLSTYLNGDIAEVIVCDSELSVADSNRVGRYLAAKWGLDWSEIS